MRTKTCEMEKQKKPLDGIKVIELTTYLAAPSAGRFLSCLGADVIKVESLEGDPWRRQGALYGIPIEENNNPLFVSANEGKKFIAINLKSDDGLKVFYELIKKSDIFISNLREKTREKLNVNFQKLLQENSRLVYGVIDGYGQKGEEAGRPAFDATAFYARGGYMLDYVPKGDPPNNYMFGSGDCYTGLSLALGVLGALVGAQLKGEGTYVNASLLHSSIWMASINYIISQYGTDYYVEKFYRCRDGLYMFAQATTPKQKKSICDLLDVDIETYDDPERIVPILKEKYAQKTFDEWQKIFSETNICTERLRHIIELSSDEQAIVNNFIAPYNRKDGNPIMVPMPPIKYEGVSENINCDTKLGCHTVDILLELGYSRENIHRMIKNKAIGV